MSVDVCFVIFGASGDLAKKKLYPALWNIYNESDVMKSCRVIGFSRSVLSKDDLVQRFSPAVKITGESGKAKFESFVQSLEYVCGDYDRPEDYHKLSNVMNELQSGTSQGNRIFYVSLPPHLHVSVSKNIQEFCSNNSGWIRIVVEKPFGSDLDSFKTLSRELLGLFSDEQIYRIDHYLAKEMIQNIMVLKYANTIFMPLWNRQYVSSVMITLKEDIGINGRQSFDQLGVIRDVIQNHLMQVLTLLAMEPPSSLSVQDIKRQKCKLLQEIQPISLDNIVLGQYVKRNDCSNTSECAVNNVGYTDTPGIPYDSLTPTFATIVLYIDNSRWKDVPFILKAGKALNERKSEVRIQFKPAHTSYLFDQQECKARNEFVMRLQPNEAIYAKFLNKIPGKEMKLKQTELDLTYHKQLQNHKGLEAYEKLLMDVFEGTKMNFVTTEELEGSWKIFTPLLNEIEQKKSPVFTYEIGSRGPAQSDKLVEKVGFVHDPNYRWNN